MEGTINMTSNTSNITATASAPNNQQQEAAVVVPTPTTKEQASNTKNKKLRAEQQSGGSEEPKRRPQQDTVVRCARCSSANTKFCYYNNYNLNQPRYFCKACRRYWTQGGALRLVPIGGGCRRNKRASGSSSSSATSSTAATPAQMENTVVTTPTATTQLMLTAGSTMSVSSPTTGLLFPNDVLPKFTPKGGSGSLELAMDEKQDFLPLAPLSSSGDQPPEELAPEESDMTPFLDMLTGGGFFDVGGSSSSSYGGDLAMSGGINGMDLSFLLPEAGVPAIDPMQTQLMEGMNNVSGELQWPSSELDNYMNYINEDGGYAAGPGAGVEQQQQVAGDQQQEEENKAKESSSNNNNDDGGSSVYNY